MGTNGGRQGGRDKESPRIGHLERERDMQKWKMKYFKKDSGFLR